MIMKIMRWLAAGVGAATVSYATYVATTWLRYGHAKRVRHVAMLHAMLHAIEVIATPVSESLGIPAMLVRVRILQIAVVGLISVWGGKRLWRFGLREAT